MEPDNLLFCLQELDHIRGHIYTFYILTSCTSKDPLSYPQVFAISS